ncbi:MAG TPA: hypothetical protein DER09_11985 [Prolixibacteraceae bacterium]|nr:hypothetical protein [Prolixibacteraceae bacterium]
MKNTFKFLFALGFVLAISACDEEVAFDALTSAPEAGSTYYLQFLNASKTMETGVTEAGGLVEATSTVAVSLMGMPSDQEITVNLTPDAANTLTSSMYTLSANSIKIPAGKTSGSVSFSTKAASMPVGQTLTFTLNMDAGEHNSPSATGTKLTYKVKRIEFCPLVNGIADLVGSWSGTDGQGDYTFPSQVTSAVNGTKLAVSGLSVGFINGFWGEEVIEGGSFDMTVKGNGMIEIPRQYIYTTTYEGDPYDYEIMGSGKWENCGTSPKLILTYDIYYPGDEKGLAASYASYLGGVTYLKAELTLSGTKSAEIRDFLNTVQNVVNKKVVK